MHCPLIQCSQYSHINALSTCVYKAYSRDCWFNMLWSIWTVICVTPTSSYDFSKVLTGELCIHYVKVPNWLLLFGPSYLVLSYYSKVIHDYIQTYLESFNLTRVFENFESLNVLTHRRFHYIHRKIILVKSFNSSKVSTSTFLYHCKCRFYL